MNRWKTHFSDIYADDVQASKNEQAELRCDVNNYQDDVEISFYIEDMTLDTVTIERYDDEGFINGTLTIPQSGDSQLFTCLVLSKKFSNSPPQNKIIQLTVYGNYRIKPKICNAIVYRSNQLRIRLF